MPAGTAAHGIVAPIAPRHYTKEDEDRWRSLVEEALREIASSVNVIGDQGVDVSQLGRWIEHRAIPRGTNDGDTIAITELLSRTRLMPVGADLYTNAVWRPASGTADSLIYKRDADDGHSFMIKPGTVNDVANTRRMHFRPSNTAAGVPNRIDFRETFGPTTSTPTSAVPNDGLSCSIQAWLRKESSGDSSHARFTFGFCDAAIVFGSKPVARCGLIGDGSGGYRFGSVHCPDGAAISGDTGASDIDANSVQPSELVSPGANWFHVKIKMVPPTPAQSGRWGAYLNGVLVATFTTNTNFPRGSQTTNRHYSNIEPMICYYPDTSQLPGVLVRDLRVTFDEVFTL